MNYLEQARILRTIIETAVQYIPDGEILEAVVLPPGVEGRHCLQRML